MSTSYPHQDDIEMISEQTVYLRGFLDAVTTEYDVSGPLKRLDIIIECLTNIALPDATEVKTATAEEINDTGDTNLSEALAGETELRETEDVSAAITPVIDATDEVTEQEAINAVLDDETPFDQPQKRSYFGDTFA